MKVRRTQILPLAETAIREALREAVREAIRDVSREREAVLATSGLRNPAPVKRDTQFSQQSDAEAWERFESIRLARSAGMAREHAR
jgi:hypothetical protein